MTNPIELVYQPSRTVYCVRSSLLAGITPQVYNTSTQLYENYSSANWSLYKIALTEVFPGIYRAVCPAGSITTPASEYFYEQLGAAADPTDTSIGSGNSQGVNIGTINGTQSSVGTNPTAVVDICNLALTHLGQKNITTLSDDTENARKCLQIYNNCRDEVLRDCDWKFATIIEELTANSVVTVVGWTYVYDMPASILKIRKIYSDDTSVFDTMLSASSILVDTIPVTNPDAIPYKIVYDVATAAQVIAVNASPAYIEYTVRIDDPSFYDALFIKALSYKLAMELANPLCGDPEEAKEMAQKYAVTISEAMKVNGEENGIPRKRKSTTLEAR